MKIRPRLLIAALTAPAFGAVVAFGLIVLLLDLVPDLGREGLARFFRDFMMFGSAVAYPVCAIVGIPAYVYLRRRGRLRFGFMLPVFVLSGVLTFVPVLRVMTGSPGAFAGILLLGAVSGTFAGAWFWLVAFGRGRADAPGLPA